MILPIGMALFVSFTDYDIVNSPNWIGFDNYIKMFRDPYFLISLKNTIIYTALFVPLGLVASLGAAILINMNKKEQVYLGHFLCAGIMLYGSNCDNMVLVA